MLSVAEYYSLAQGQSFPPIVWPPPPRDPLPPFPSITAEQPGPPQASCWAAAPYTHTAPWDIPQQPDRRWHRGNFSGVRVPGLTEGGNDKDPSLMMTWDLVRYSPAQRALAIDYYARVCGYTHVVLGRQQTLNNHCTLDDLLVTAELCQRAGLYVCMIAVSDGDSFDVAIPWLDALDAANLLTTICICWQIDKYYEPHQIVILIEDAAAYAHPRGLLTTVHWGGGYPGWAQSCACWDDLTEDTWGIHDRFSFQAVLASQLDGHYGQCDTESDIDEVQSWLRKALIAMPEPMFLVCAEDDAQAEYDQPHQRLELYGDMKGLLATYISQAGRISYLNGARQPDGRVW